MTELIGAVLIHTIYFFIRVCRKLLFWMTRVKPNSKKYAILIRAIYQNIEVCRKFTYYFDVDVEKKW